MAHADNAEPILRNPGHQKEDRLANQFVNRTEKWGNKAQAHGPADAKDPDNQQSRSQQEKKAPPGGFEDTPIPKAPPGFTLKITFHGAENLPFSDINTISSDPYLVATMKTSLQKRNKQDPDLRLRTPTVHRDTNPKWETEWIVANVPASGFFLKCRLYDEDPADHDDRLGNAHIVIDDISEGWKGFKERKFDIKKRMGSKRAYLFRGCAAMLNRNIKMGGDVIVSIENLGRTEDLGEERGGRMWTVGPLAWSRHYSPLIGRLVGTKDVGQAKDGDKAVERYNFQAIQIQLAGPVPAGLYHRYVEFKPFVAGMFTSHSLRGRILNRALHHQHARIYNYDRSTLYGFFAKPCADMTKQFLEFVHYDQGGRIFTYVMTLDAQWRFTETGKEFGIDMLSKHTMHSDVSIYIAFSGEFFVRRLKRPKRIERKESERSQKGGVDRLEDSTLPPAPEPEDEDQPVSAETRDPGHYELIIDNDSGTYRPNAKMLGKLREFMERNLPGLRVVTLDCQADEERMGRMKDEQRQRKKQSAKGREITYMQNRSTSSISSSEVSELEEREQNLRKDGNQEHANGSTAQPEGGATKAKMSGWKEKAGAVKGAMGGIAHMSSASMHRDGPETGEAEKGGFVGENAPVIQKEKAEHGEKPQALEQGEES